MTRTRFSLSCNRELFERYEPTRPPYFLTPAHQQAILGVEADL